MQAERVDKYAHAHYAVTEHYSRRRHHINVRLLSPVTQASGPVILEYLKFRPPRPIQLWGLRVVIIHLYS
jgi:hypothetical protein